MPCGSPRTTSERSAAVASGLIADAPRCSTVLPGRHRSHPRADASAGGPAGRAPERLDAAVSLLSPTAPVRWGGRHATTALAVGLRRLVDNPVSPASRHWSIASLRLLDPLNIPPVPTPIAVAASTRAARRRSRPRQDVGAFPPEFGVPYVVPRQSMPQTATTRGSGTP